MEYLLDEMVKVMYVKSEDNVADICTKNLQGKLFDKHSNKLVHDVAFFTQCLAQRMGREDTNKFFTRLNTRTDKLFTRLNTKIEKATKLENRWNQPEPWEQPLGEFKLRELGWSHKRLVWIGNYSRIDQFKKTIQGPLQADYHKRWGDRTGKQILHDEEKKQKGNYEFQK